MSWMGNCRIQNFLSFQGTRSSEKLSSAVPGSNTFLLVCGLVSLGSVGPVVGVIIAKRIGKTSVIMLDLQDTQSMAGMLNSQLPTQRSVFRCTSRTATSRQ